MGDQPRGLGEYSDALRFGQAVWFFIGVFSAARIHVITHGVMFVMQFFNWAQFALALLTFELLLRFFSRSQWPFTNARAEKCDIGGDISFKGFNISKLVLVLRVL